MKKTVKRTIIILVCIFVYELGGALLPFMQIKQTGDSFKEQFRPEEFYGTEDGVDRAAIVETSMDALNSRIQMIQQAQERIILSTFDIREGESTDDIFSAVQEAANRGVKVQILVDGLYGTLHMSGKPIFYALGTNPNIEIRFYNIPSLLKPWTINGRMHDKYVMIDDKLLLMGGRNTFDYFLGEYDMADLSYDRDVLIYNTAFQTEQSRESVITQMKSYFEEVWNSEDCVTNFEAPSYLIREEVEDEKKELQFHYQEFMEQYPELEDRNVDYRDLTVPIKKATLIYNPTHIWAKEPWVWYQLQYLMEHAKERAYIHTPYAVLSKDMYEGMEAVSRRVPDFSMLVNAAAVGDNIMASSDYIYNRDKILDTGVDLFEFFGERSSHGKSMLIDHNLSLIGSYNLDMRSTYIDTEVMLVIHGEELNQMLEGRIMDMQKQSLQVEKGGNYIAQKNVIEKEIPENKQKLFRITPWLFQLFRYMI